MNKTPTLTRNWFDQGGQAYAQFRPEYPPELSAWLASIAPDTALAVDVGCGNGQLTEPLAAHFTQVLGFDPSASQIAQSSARSNVAYQCAPAECLPVAEGCASLITAAQAAHWFDLPAFYAEARRIAAPGAVLALICYGVLNLDAGLDERFQRFYWQEIGPFWPAGRALVDKGYATLAFPFEPLPVPPLQIRLEWDLPAFLGYVSTWSAVRQAREAGQEAVLQRFAEDLSAHWGNPGDRRTVVWPIKMRVGTIGP